MSREIDLVARALEARLPGRVSRSFPSAELTTYRVGGPLAVLVRAGDDRELEAVAGVLREHPVPTLPIGRGSNLLVADDGFAGLALVLDGEHEAVVPRAASATVDAGGAAALPVLARLAAAAGIAALEFYVGIPGSVGGAVRMNAGGHGSETRDVLIGATVLDLDRGLIDDRPAESLDLGYRRSALTDRHLVVRATFRGTPADPASCERRIAEIVRWRREHQPGGPNAGSVFANPDGDAAGRLVDQCGLKGLRIGGAVVSDKHANFIQALPGGRAGDVRALVLEVQRRVEESTGVRLRPEMRFVGFEGSGMSAGAAGAAR